jgi:hypothetical protein
MRRSYKLFLFFAVSMLMLVACSSPPSCSQGGFQAGEQVTVTYTPPSGASCPTTGPVPVQQGSGCVVVLTADSNGNISVPDCDKIVLAT